MTPAMLPGLIPWFLIAAFWVFVIWAIAALIGHAVVEAMLMLNGFELSAGVDESEAEILAVAAGERSGEEFRAWIEANLVRLGSTGAGPGPASSG